MTDVFEGREKYNPIQMIIFSALVFLVIAFNGTAYSILPSGLITFLLVNKTVYYYSKKKHHLLIQKLVKETKKNPEAYEEKYKELREEEKKETKVFFSILFVFIFLFSFEINFIYKLVDDVILIALFFTGVLISYFKVDAKAQKRKLIQKRLDDYLNS